MVWSNKHFQLIVCWRIRSSSTKVYHCIQKVPGISEISKWAVPAKTESPTAHVRRCLRLKLPLRLLKKTNNFEFGWIFPHEDYKLCENGRTLSALRSAARATTPAGPRSLPLAGCLGHGIKWFGILGLHIFGFVSRTCYKFLEKRDGHYQSLGLTLAGKLSGEKMSTILIKPSCRIDQLNERTKSLVWRQIKKCRKKIHTEPKRAELWILIWNSN